MKLSTIVAAGAAMAGAAVAFSATSASAVQVYETYTYSGADYAQLYVTNNSMSTLTNVTIAGTNFGNLAPGASTGLYNDGDPTEGGATSALISYGVGSNTYSFTAPVYDYDYNTTQVVGAGGVPEPATWSLMLVAIAGVGGAMRSRRRLAPAAVA